jgi:hypothetical protein
MKRNLIAAAAAALALVANAAFAEPTIDVFLGNGQDTVWSKAPEATSYQDAQGAMSLGDELNSHIYTFNP